MTIIVFVVDNTTSMNQRTYQGTTLLDSAKTIVETFFKMRLNKYRVDRYFIFTLNPYPYNMKLAGWRQNSDLQSLHTALSRIKPDGTVGLGDAIGNAFRLLNLNRMQVGFENYGMGMYMSYFEPAVVIAVTNHNTHFENINPLAASVPGGDLTAGLHRWDYRLYSVLLQNPGLIDSVYDLPRPLSLDLSSPVFASSKYTGGDVFVLADLRAVPQCVEAIGNKCQPGVVIELVDTSNDKEHIITKQLVHVKLVGRVGSSWPIPEHFWPTDELLLSKLPSRPPNPIIQVSLSNESQPKFPEYFPVDRYDLEPSPFTQKVIEHGDASIIWPCFVKGSGQARDAPFGYCKSTTDLQTVHLHVLPYNYRVLSDLLTELHEIHGMRMTENWGLKFMNYLASIPRYYFSPISKAFERLGFQGVIKPEALDRTLPYQLRNNLQKLRHSAKLDYDQFVHVVEGAESPPPLIKLPQNVFSSRRPFVELRAFTSVKRPPGNLFYEQPCSIPRRKLRKILPKLRRNLDAILDGIGRPMDREGIHNQALSEMGDYINYKFAQPQISPLRELTPSPERLDTFGNPFRRKSSAVFVADEVFVEDVGLSGQSPNSAAVSLSNRRRSNVSLSGRAKGPLPAYITYANWHKWSRSNSLASSSPQRDEFSSCPSPIPIIDSGHSSPLNCLSPPNNDVWRDHADLKRQKNICSEDKISFDVNSDIVSQIIELIRKPALDGSEVFHFLSRLVGNLNLRYASISFVMAESLRFKRMELYKQLDEWRSSCLDFSQSNLELPVTNTSPSNNTQISDKTVMNGINSYR